MNMWQQKSVVISRDDAVVGTLQRWSNRKAARAAKDAMKSQLQPEGGRYKSQVSGTPKRWAIDSPQAGEFNNIDAVYVPRSESESEDYDMCVASDEEGLALGASNRISIDDWDEEQNTSLGMCTTNLKRMSPGTDCDALACIQANRVKKGPPEKCETSKTCREGMCSWPNL